VTIAQLMELKFYLNKFAKLDNIEYYSFNTILSMKKLYEEYLNDTEGLDPDFPTLNFGGKGKKISIGTNIYSLFDDENDIPEDYKGINEGRLNLIK